MFIFVRDNVFMCIDCYESICYELHIERFECNFG